MPAFPSVSHNRLCVLLESMTTGHRGREASAELSMNLHLVCWGCDPISPAQALLIVFRFWRIAGPPSPFFTAFVMYYTESDIVNYLLLQNHYFYCKTFPLQYKKKNVVPAGYRKMVNSHISGTFQKILR